MLLSAPSRRRTRLGAIPLLFLTIVGLLVGGLGAPAFAATGTVSGTVLGANNLGLQGVQVTLGTLTNGVFSPSTVQAETTDQSGNYSFDANDNVVAGTNYTVRFTARDYKVAYYSGSASSAATSPAQASTFSVANDQARTGISAKLTVKPSINGIIVGADDNPLSGAAVEIGTVAAGVYSRLTSVASVTTDGAGAYQLASVPTGDDYVVRVSAAGYQSAFVVLNGTATADPAAATPVDVATDDISGFSTKMSASATVSGALLGASGLALPGASVRLGTVDSAGAFVPLAGALTSTDASGRYAFGTGIAPGSYKVQFTAPDYKLGYYNGSAQSASLTPSGGSTITVQAGKTVTGVSAKLTAKPSVSGLIVGADDKPVPGATVQVGEVSNGVFVATTGVAPATTSGSGTYTVLDVPSGSDFIVKVTSNAYSDSFVVLNANATSNPANATTFDVANDDITGWNTKLVGATPPLVSGRVTDSQGEPVQDAKVTLYELQVAGGQGGGTATFKAVKDVLTAADGTYRLVAPKDGNYRLGFSKAGFADIFYPAAGRLEDADDLQLATGKPLTGYDVVFALLGDVELSFQNGDGTRYGDGGTLEFWREVTQRDPATNTTTTFWRRIATTTIVDSRTAGTGTPPAVLGLATASIPAGDYAIKAILPGRGEGFLPSLQGLDQAQKLTVVGEQTVKRTYGLVVTGLAGRVVDRLDNPVAGATVTASYTYVSNIVNGQPITSERIIADARTTTTGGRYFFGLVPRTYRLDVTATLSGAQTSGSRTYTLTSNASGIDIPVGQDLVLSTMSPWVSGLAQAGETLTCDPGTFNPVATVVGYQWLRNGSVINGQTEKTYNISILDSGSRYACRVTGSAVGFTATTHTSAQTGPTASFLGSAAFENRRAPVVTGDPITGGKLKTDPGRWSVEPSSVAYQWFADATAIPGATAPELVLTGNELGDAITVQVTATSGSATAKASSVPTSRVEQGRVVNKTAPTISGPMVAGEQVTANPGTWQPNDVTLAYQWLADGTVLVGATQSVFTPSTKEIGSRLSVLVTATAPGFTSTTVESARGAAVTAGTSFTNVVAPSIGGTPAVGSVLTAENGTWTPTPTSFTYQWAVDGAAVPGATGRTFTLTQQVVGARISVAVTAQKSDVPDRTVTSAAVGPVVAQGVTVTDGPRISGTPAVGELLTVSTGTTNPSSASASVQWLRDGAPIAGATGLQYRPVAADAGTLISAKVTYAASGFASTVRDAPGVRVAEEGDAAVKPSVDVTKKIKGTKLVLKVNVTATTQDPVEGEVELTENGKSLVSKTLVAGKRKFVVRGFKRGFHSVQITFLGNDLVKERTKTITFNVR